MRPGIIGIHWIDDKNVAVRQAIGDDAPIDIIGIIFDIFAGRRQYPA